MCKQAICPLCGKPVRAYVKGAVCYHTPCLMKHLQPVREKYLEMKARYEH